jgi:hypothetical protein
VPPEACANGGHTQHGLAHLDRLWLPPRQHGGDQDHEPRPWQVEQEADAEAQVQHRQHDRREVDYHFPRLR